MRRFGFILVTMTVLLSLCAVPAIAKTTWNVNSVWPPKNPHSVGLIEFADKVKAATKGDLELIVQTGGSLGYKGPELLKAVRDGLLPLSDMLISGVAGDEKLFQIVTLPFLAKDFQELRLLTDISRPYFDKVAKKWNQKILYIAPWPGAGLWTKKKVMTLADMKGLKTRTYDKNGALVVEATGGTPYALPFSEVYTSLQTGLIDSVITSSPTAVDAKFWEVLNYFERINITIATDMVNVNLNSFNKLSKSIQSTLVSIGKEMENVMWERVPVLDKEMEALCNKNGMESLPVSKEIMADLSKITESIRADWLKDAPADGKKIYQDFMKKVGR
ncbi:MAG: TRAP transporter substrate-binding protein [Deltaproteobacteria bacterium]|nr:TRAP transporter substrate-binding protein [Deltaproteobacteria bacterium]